MLYLIRQCEEREQCNNTTLITRIIFVIQPVLGSTFDVMGIQCDLVNDGGNLGSEVYSGSPDAP